MIVNLRPPFERGLCARSFEDHQIRAVTVHIQGGSQRGDGEQVAAGVRNFPNEFSSAFDFVREFFLFWHERIAESIGILLETEIALHNEDPFARIANSHDIHREGKAIQQLRSEFAFFRIHCPDQNEACRMCERDSLALDHVHAHRSGVQQNVHYMIVQQVYLINIKQAAICRCQYSRFEVPLTLLNGLLDIERSNHAVFRRGNRQVHKRGGLYMKRKFLCIAICALLAFCAPGGRFIGITTETTLINNLYFGKQRGQRTRSSGFRGAALTTNEHTADAGIHSI